jgi:hypothetical protein
MPQSESPRNFPERIRFNRNGCYIDSSSAIKVFKSHTTTPSKDY